MTVRRRGFQAAIAASVAGLFAGAAQAELAWAAASGNRLQSFDTSNPGTLFTDLQITGLGAGEQVRGIDIRPATGEMYAITTGSTLYKLNPNTAVATPVIGGAPFVLSGVQFGFDFNPVADLIRVTSNTGQNLRINPNDGGLVATDTNIAYGPADVNFGLPAAPTGAAYSNNFPSPGSTTLYVIDSLQNALTTMNPPNAGTLSTVGFFGTDFTDIDGFDISGVTGNAYALLTKPGFNTELYSVNLLTGAVTPLGAVGAGDLTLRGLALVPEPTSLALLALGGLFLRRR